MSPETESQSKRYLEGNSQMTEHTNTPIHEALLQDLEMKIHKHPSAQGHGERNEEAFSDASGISSNSNGHRSNGDSLREPKTLLSIEDIRTETSYHKHMNRYEQSITSEMKVGVSSDNIKFHSLEKLSDDFRPQNDFREHNYSNDSERRSLSGGDQVDPHHTNNNGNSNSNKTEKNSEDALNGHDEEDNGGNNRSENSSFSASENERSTEENAEDQVSRANFPTYEGAHDSKYQQYKVLVDPEQDDRAVEIALCSTARPHMRCFHCAWVSFFVAFLCWFAIAPLLSEVTISLDLTKEQVWTSNMIAVAGSAILRVVIGPLCDKYGARLCSSGVLLVTAIPTMALGLANNYITFSSLRLLIGMAGATFVTGQYWTSSVFTREVAGTANALVAGWGNLGGGITQILTGSILFPLFKWMYKDRSIDDGMSSIGEDVANRLLRAEDKAWRSAPVVPGLLALMTSFYFYQYADDSPKGNYHKRKKQGFITDVKVWEALRTGLKDFNTWLLFLQYACCFGVELTVNNAAPLYFKEVFNQSTESAASITSIFGFMNIFARGFGGFMSDMCNAWDGMRGRLAWQTFLLLCEGLSTILFVYSNTLSTSILTLALFSFFVQATEGSSFGIVPYVNPKITGSIVGIVGAGGNVGGICFSFLFREFSYKEAFSAMGWCVVVSSGLSFFVLIRGHAGLTCGKDAPEVRSALRRRNRNVDGNSNAEGLEMAQSDVSFQLSNASINEEMEISQQGKRPDLSGADIVIPMSVPVVEDISPDTEYFQNHDGFQTGKRYYESDSSISSHSKESNDEK